MVSVFSWYFFTTVTETNPPFLENLSPSRNETGVEIDTNISFFVVDEGSGVDGSTIDAYINGADAYRVGVGFVSPYNGSGSSFTYLPGGSIYGYDAYQIVIEPTVSFTLSSVNNVRVKASDYDNNWMDDNWNFTCESTFNRLYYSDSYGVHKISIKDLVGESQENTELILSTQTTPSIPRNYVQYISGSYIDGYSLLCLSIGSGDGGGGGITASWGEAIWGDFIWGYIGSGSGSSDGYGIIIVQNERTTNTYANGYVCNMAQLNNNGTLYLINNSSNRIEVYYGANTRSGTSRSPDYVYDGYSTPSLFSNSGDVGTIHSLTIVSNTSEKLSNGTKLYVGQSIGMTIIDAYDLESTAGYSAGMDNLGEANYYGISGSGATNECIGGTIPNVSDILPYIDENIILVVTNDGYGTSGGGLTQIELPNRKIIFMDGSLGFVPSANIRKTSKPQ